jgi:uroporphyrinogen decarboxylase
MQTALAGGQPDRIPIALAFFPTTLPQLLLDMRRNQQLVNYLSDQLTSIHVDNAVMLAQAAVDILCLDDDIATPSSMIVSPTMWRDFLKPRMKKIVDMAKEAKPDLFVLYQSDGYIEPIISDLIEIGVDVLNPIQPDVMSPDEIKEKYGDKLALWGGVGTQTLWSWGRPKDIEEGVRLRVETLDQNEGYVICPAYDIDVPQVPLGNVAAFVEAAKKFGKSTVE